MTPETFRAWRLRLKSIENRRTVTQREAGDRLGLSKDTIYAYEAGKLPVPLTVALACAAVERGVPPVE